MRCVAYCRVSTEEGEQLNSLQNQIEYYTELFQQNGYESAKVGVFHKKNGTSEFLSNGIFADQGISGTKTLKREAFNNMMYHAKNRMFDMIYCKNIQRFSRNVAEGAAALKELKQCGVNVFFQDNGLDFFANEDTINILLSISASESRQKSSAVKFGIRKAQQHGKWSSGVPYGYNRINGYLEINLEEAEIVKKIYNWYLDGWGRTKIMRHLNATGTLSRGYIWYQGHLHTILTNKIYTGVQITHRVESHDVNVKVLKEVNVEDHIVVERPEITIIDKDTFQRVQDMKEKKAKQYESKKESEKHLFSNVLECGNCGSSLRAKWRRTTTKGITHNIDKLEYVCTKNDSSGTYGCEFRNAVKEDYLLEYVKSEINNLRNNNAIKLHNIFNLYMSNYYEINTKERNSEIDQEIYELKKEQDNKIRLNTLDNNIISDKELIEWGKEFRQKLSALENEQSKLLNLDKEIIKVKKDFSNFIAFLDTINAEELNNQTIKKIFNHIKISTSNVTNMQEIPKAKLGTFIYKFKGKTYMKRIDLITNFLEKNSSRIILEYIYKNNPTSKEFIAATTSI